MVLNLSIYAIPAYWFISLWPHVYAAQTIKDANNGLQNGVNPHGIDTIAGYKKTVPAEVFAKFEKAEAAHKNGMENFPLILAAVALGNMAKLSPETMNAATGSFLALRIAYTLLYIKTTRNRTSLVRSATFAVSSLILLGTIIKAGNVLSTQI